MPSHRRREREKALDRMLQTRSDAWAAAGLEMEVDEHETRRAWGRLTVALILLIATIVAEQKALHHFNHLTPKAHRDSLIVTLITVAAVILVLILGWRISRDVARIAPALFRRLDPATAGTVQFLTRFLAVAATVLTALAVAGISFQALAVGGAFTAVVVGLAAQQTLGNLFAGMVLLSARPFRLGERVRLRAGALGGVTEGIVSSLGLLYTTLSSGEDRMLVPNTMVLSSVVVPVREPESVDVRVTLGSGAVPSQVQAILDQNVAVPTRTPPSVILEEIDGPNVIVRVQATPERRADGAKLADEIIAALGSVTGKHNEVAPTEVEQTP